MLHLGCAAHLAVNSSRYLRLQVACLQQSAPFPEPAPEVDTRCSPPSRLTYGLRVAAAFTLRGLLRKVRRPCGPSSMTGASNEPQHSTAAPACGTRSGSVYDATPTYARNTLCSSTCPLNRPARPMVHAHLQSTCLPRPSQSSRHVQLNHPPLASTALAASSWSTRGPPPGHRAPPYSWFFIPLLHAAARSCTPTQSNNGKPTPFTAGCGRMP